MSFFNKKGGKQAGGKAAEPAKAPEPAKAAEPAKVEAQPTAQATQNEAVTVKKEKMDESDAPLNCTHCTKTLIGQRYVLKEDKPYCIPCYEEVFSNVCFACKVKIGCEQKVLSLSSLPSRFSSVLIDLLFIV